MDAQICCLCRENDGTLFIGCASDSTHLHLICGPCRLRVMGPFGSEALKECPDVKNVLEDLENA